jgi:predicted ATPase
VQESPGRTLTRSIVASLQPHRALLVLDSCEHVIDGAAELARAVAEGCPDVRVLATSREGLGVAGEQLLAVAPLDPSGPGVELFVERAMAASASFDPLAQRAEVEEICRRLDGVPLAIELAAARTTSLSPADLVERLDDRLRLLSGGRRNSVERHRTMRATVQWSYDLLSRPEQLLFQRLSIFAGPFDLAAAEDVAALASAEGEGGAPDSLDPLDVDDLLGGLVERSMLVVESSPFGRRFRLLETMRQFGAEHLSAAGDTERMAERHARWCLDRVTAIGELLAGPAEIEGVARLGELWPNLRGAIDWACTTRDRRLAHALLRPVAAEVYLRSQSEIGDWSERLLEMTPPDDEDMLAFGLMWAGRRYMRNMDRDGYARLMARHPPVDHPMVHYAHAFLWSDYAAMAKWAPLATEALRAAGDDHLADRFDLAGVGMMLLLTGRLAECDDHVGALAARYRVEGPPTGLNWALFYLGSSALGQRDHVAAWAYFDEAAQVAIPPRTTTLANPVASRAALRRGDRRLAYVTLRSYVDELIEDDNMFMAKVACGEFVVMMAKVEQWAAGARMLEYLRASGAFGDSAALESTVAAAVERISAHVDLTRPTGGAALDDRAALAFMQSTLTDLADPNPANPVL